MHDFRYIGSKLHCENVPIESLVKRFSSPLYVYSQSTLTDHFSKLTTALSSLDHLVCYAMKSNSNRSVLKVMSDLGSGFDIVSGGELERVVASGGDSRKCIFSGVGKTESEIALALRKGIYSFNVESEPELERIDRVAQQLKKEAPIAIRVNPDVDAKTHSKITTGTYDNKFGIAFEKVRGVYARAAKMRNIRLRGLQMHIGSQLTKVGPFEAAVRKVVPLAQDLAKKYDLEFFSIGGGMGIIYEPALKSGDANWWRKSKARNILTPAKYATALVPLLKPLGLRILVEPGRFISGNAGILVTRVEYVKRTGKKNFVIVDAAMNDLIRPAFYESYHEIIPVWRKGGTRVKSDVVGPICESGDTFCKDRPLPRVKEGDYLAMLSAGAYGFVMASTYNTRPMAAEVLVKGKRAAVVRKRQATVDVWAGETIAPWQK
ncbi:MAG: diaminopimelate decarboxylase [Verrucomicrobiota bacterium]|nr:diaminopimelate decarboxylase [Verrucomicrobiota bacterium]